MKFTETENNEVLIEPEVKDQQSMELEQLRLEKAKREETDRKLAKLAAELGITL